MKVLLIPISLFCLWLSFAPGTVYGQDKDLNLFQADSMRAREIADLKFGMFICWSFSTFSGQEWTPTLDKDASYFRATGCDTDQWCQVAREAGMGWPNSGNHVINTDLSWPCIVLKGTGTGREQRTAKAMHMAVAQIRT